MFIQPDLCWPSKIPFPWKENEPAVPAVIDAWKSNREACVFAVVAGGLRHGVERERIAAGATDQR